MPLVKPNIRSFWEFHSTEKFVGISIPLHSESCLNISKELRMQIFTKVFYRMVSLASNWIKIYCLVWNIKFSELVIDSLCFWYFLLMGVSYGYRQFDCWMICDIKMSDVWVLLSLGRCGRSIFSRFNTAAVIVSQVSVISLYWIEYLHTWFIMAKANASKIEQLGKEGKQMGETQRRTTPLVMVKDD